MRATATCCPRASPGSSKRFRWVDKFGHEWGAQVNNRTNGTGCPYCASQLVLAGFNDLATNRPDIAAEWHPAKNGDLRPDTIAPQSNRKVWFRCRDGHEWLSTVNNPRPLRRPAFPDLWPSHQRTRLPGRPAPADHRGRQAGCTGLHARLSG